MTQPQTPAPASPPASAPALNPPTWSGRKTAVAAALAIGISSLGAVGAAAAVPSGSFQGDQTGGPPGLGPGGRGGFGPPGGQFPQCPNGGQPAKDLSLLPVCGAIRPLHGQRARAGSRPTP